jgi:hypothetical protein
VVKGDTTSMALCSFYKVANKDYACTIGVPNEFSGPGHNFWYGFFNTNFQLDAEVELDLSK